MVMAMAAYGLKVSSKIECLLSTVSPKIVPNNLDVVLKSKIVCNCLRKIYVKIYSSTTDRFWSKIDLVKWCTVTSRH